MKRNEIIAITVILAMAALLGCLASCNTERSGWYPMSGTVVGVNRADDIVTFSNPNGQKFSFYGSEDWGEGDKVAVIMDDNGTEYVDDDIVIMAYYQG